MRFMAVLLFCVGFTVSAQAQSRGGVGAVLATDYPSNFGVQANGYWAVSKDIPQLRFGGAATWMLPDEGVSVFAFDANLHYIVYQVDAVRVYPVLGLNLSYAIIENFDDDHEFGLNLGGGAEVDLPFGTAYGEVVGLIISDYDQVMFNMGMRWPLQGRARK